MPCFYCSDESCEDFDHPQFGQGKAEDGVCRLCGKKTLKDKPSVPPEYRRRLAADPSGAAVLMPKSETRRLFYCQNPEQSGDTTGVGMALALFPAMNLVFFASRNNVGAAKGYLTYYSDIAGSSSRIVLLVGDEDVKARKNAEIFTDPKELTKKLQDLDQLTAPKKKGKGGPNVATMLDDELLEKLQDSGWPHVPLVAPRTLLPSRLRAARTEWVIVDHATALHAIEAAFVEVRTELVSIAEAMTLLTEEFRSSTSDSIGGISARFAKLKSRLSRAEATRATLNSDLILAREAILSGSPPSVGYGVTDLIERLRYARTYGIYVVEGTAKRTVIVIARGWEEASAAATFIAPETFPKGARAKDLVPPADREKDRNDRFSASKGLLEMRLKRHLERSKELSSGYQQAMESAGSVQELAGRVVPWLGFSLRSANQLYQDLTGYSVTLRDTVVATTTTTATTTAKKEEEPKEEPKQEPKKKSKKEQEKEDYILDAGKRFQTIMRVGSYEYFPIGDTSRNILALLQLEGLKGLTFRLYERLAGGRAKVAQAVKKHMIDAIRALVPKGEKRRPTVVLIWVRGLNDKEMSACTKAGMTGAAVNDAAINDFGENKRNPHHIMTAQLASQLQAWFRFYNDNESATADAKRYFIPLLIGDPIRYDQYDAKGAFYAEAADFINYWTTADLRGVVGGPHFRFLQLCAITEMFITADIDVMQIGVRSGALEQGMYQGMPTIYIEEHFCGTGDRMASLTHQGPSRAAADLIFRELTRTASEEQRAELARIRALIEEQSASDKILDIAKLGIVTEDFREPIQRILALHAAIRLRPIYDSKIEQSDPDEPLTGVFPPEPSSARRGFPHFYRLVTRHFVGLNQARTKENLDLYLAWFGEFLRGETLELHTGDEERARVFRGGLHPDELWIMHLYVRRICADFDNLRKRIASMPAASSDGEYRPPPVSPARSIIGITNTLNYCYVNSALQLLSVLDVEENYCYDGEGTYADANFAQAILDFITGLSIDAGSGRYLDGGTFGNVSSVATRQDTVGLRTILAQHLGWPSIHRQEDSAEALTDMLASLGIDRRRGSEPLNFSPGALALLAEEEFNLRRPSRMHFLAEIRTTYLIEGAGSARNPLVGATWMNVSDNGSIARRECMNALNLSIDATVRTLQEVVNGNWNREFEGQEMTRDNVVTTSGTYYRAAPRVAERFRFRFTPPQHLLVTVKRFDDRLNKIDTDVTNATTFDSDEDTHYDLMAFICHLGTTMRNGHYIAYVLNSGHWYKIDDSTVTVDPGDLQAAMAKAYILLFGKR